MGTPVAYNRRGLQIRDAWFLARFGKGGLPAQSDWNPEARRLFRPRAALTEGEKQPMTTHNYVKQTVFLVVLGILAAMPATPAAHEGPPPPPPPAVPAIAQTGVVISNLLPKINAISSESITSIFGSDFAPAGFIDPNATLDADGLVATKQSGVCVEIDGKRAPMFHPGFPF